MGINSSLLKSVQTIVDKAIEVAPFDKTRQAQVITNNGDGSYAIRLDGILYNNVPSYPKANTLEVGSIVKIVMPVNQSSQMYIQSSTSGSAGSINNVLIVGNKTSEEINVVDMTNPKLTLDNYQIAGSIDKEIYDALVALGWTDVIV